MIISELKNITYLYKPQNEGVSNRNIILNISERIALIGENGCGKTTLIKLLAGIILPQNGSGLPITDLSISYLPTDVTNYLLPWYNVSKNISFFNSLHKKRTENELNEFINVYFCDTPFNYDKIKNRKIYELSTGQKAIIALFCLLINKPDIILLDEVFANLSHKTVEILFSKIIFFNPKLVIFTSHCESIVKEYATHIYYIEKNEKIST